jgi:AcrR family transcriptional regulator
MSKAKKTRRYIIEKTAELFNKKGFAGTSLSDLTTATSLTKGSIYGNFKDKEEVAEAAFNFNYQNLIKSFTPNLSAASNSKEKLHAFLNSYEQVFEPLMKSGGCPILNNAVDADDTNERMKQLSLKALSDWENNLVSLIKSGIKKKEINSSVNAQYYADLFISLIEGSLMLSKVSEESRHFRNAIKHLRAIVDGVF